MVYPSSEIVRLSAEQSHSIDLSLPRSLTLTMTLGGQDAGQCNLRVRPGTAGLRLVLQDATVIDAETHPSMKLSHSSDGMVLQFDEIERQSLIRIKIPYSLEGHGEVVAGLKCLLGFDIDGESFTLHQTCMAETSLPPSVNVQDLHRSDYWLSQFLIAPATAAPIVLQRCDIEDAEGLEVDSFGSLATHTTVFPQQPAKWLARLQRKIPSQSAGANAFTLKVHYQRVDEMALASVQTQFLAAAKSAGLEAAGDLLNSHLVRTLKARWSAQDLEMLGLTQEVEVWEKDDLQWRDVLWAFEGRNKAKIDAWLSSWHAGHKIVKFDQSSGVTRELSLKVNVPSRPTVVTTALEPRLSKERTTATLGQPLACDLGISVTGEQDTRIQYSYELFAPTDTWLIGGRKKGIFSADVDVRIPMILFPQRNGLLLLPMIDVRCRRQDGKSPQATEGDWVDVPIELYNKTLSKCVQVTANLQSVTVGLTTEETASNAGTGPGVNSGVLLQSQDRCDRYL